MFKIAIIDDIQENTSCLQSLLNDYAARNDKDFNIVTFDSTINFLDKYDSSYDILFVDINMPVMSGYELSRKIRSIDETIMIVFVTTMKQYAVDGYSVNAFDFLLKPVVYGRLKQTLDKALYLLDKKKSSVIQIKTGGRMRVIDTSAVMYIESNRHNIFIYTEKDRYETNGTLKQMESVMPKEFFVRVNYAFIVNMRYISKINGNDIVMEDQKIITIPHGKKKIFMSEFSVYLCNYRGC